MRRKYNRRPTRKFYILNDRIRGETFRVVDDTGYQVGILGREEALKLSREQEKDLVLISPKAVPPVVKLIDFKKFLYQEDKKERESKKSQKKGGTKNIKLSLFIGEADLERQLNKGQGFLDKGYQLRIKLALKGREMGKKNMAYDFIKSCVSKLINCYVATEPRFHGRVISTVVTKGQNKDENKDENTQIGYKKVQNN